MFLRFAAVPRWQNLNHFKEVMGVSFADGTKFEDILKVIDVDSDALEISL
jgi:hypothetical protein